MTQQFSMAQTMERFDSLKFNFQTFPSLGDHQWDYMLFNGQFSTELPSSFFLKFEGAYRADRFTFFNIPDFDSTVLNRFHTIGLNVGLEKKFQADWAVNLSFMPRLASNFSTSPTKDDLLYNYGVSLQKSWVSTKHSYALTVGIERNTYLGEPKYLPILAFEHQLSNTLAYRIGFPKSAFMVTFDDRNGISATANFNGVYLNNSYEPFLLDGQAISGQSKLVYNELAFGLNYKFKLQPRITTQVQIGYSVNNPLELRDEKGGLLFEFQTDSTVYFEMGLIYRLKKSNNE